MNFGANFGRDRAPVDPEVAAAKASARKRRRIILGLVAAALLVLGYFVGAAFLPRWWARQIGNWVDDRFTFGLLYGLAFGIVCTLIPLAIAIGAFLRPLNAKVRTALVVLAVVIALPNLLTLGISTGTGSGAHAGSRILDDRAPFFQGATLIGAIVGVVLLALGYWQYRANKKVRQAKRDAKARRKAGIMTVDSASTDTPPPSATT